MVCVRKGVVRREGVGGGERARGNLYRPERGDTLQTPNNAHITYNFSFLEHT